jgi:protein tyrosine/serine phosphatase
MASSRHYTVSGVFLGLVLLGVGCAEHTSTPLGTIKNFDTVEWTGPGEPPAGRPVLYRGQAPKKFSDIEALANGKQVKTIIDLRMGTKDVTIDNQKHSGVFVDDDREMEQEPCWASQSNPKVHYVLLRTNLDEGKNHVGADRVVAQADDFLRRTRLPKDDKDFIETPAFVHCQEGHDRTGLFVARFRICQDKWNPQRTVDEMMAHGENPFFWFWLNDYVKKMKPCP